MKNKYMMEMRTFMNIVSTPPLLERADVNSSEFQNWFRGSKVVDQHGDPQLCHHGSASWNGDANIGSFRPFTHFGTIKAANKRLKYLQSPSGVQAIYPVYLSIKNPFKISDGRGVDHGAYEYISCMAFGSIRQNISDEKVLKSLNARYGVISIDDFLNVKNAPSSKKRSMALDIIKRAGIDGFYYKNAIEDRGSISWVIISLDQVWPVFQTRPDFQ